MPYPSLQNLSTEVRAAAVAWFASHGLPTDAKYPHRLASDTDWQHNLILPEVRDYIAQELADAQAGRRCSFALHRDVGNGASSQAMAFNLLGPLLARNDLAPLAAVVTAAGLPWPRQPQAALEVENRVVFSEQRGQPTSIDLVINGGPADCGPICMEVKLTEGGFGNCGLFANGECSVDGNNPLGDLMQCKLYEKGYLYWQRMAEHGLLTEALREGEQCPLTCNYQFFRELLFALYYGGNFVLLHDERSPVFVGAPLSLFPLLQTKLPEQMRSRVAAISVQDLVAAIRATGRHEDWLGLFMQKYGLT
ncbi:MAG: hypothetical protein EI684_07765 [Candidatus Viridilinea halotolerans]|uniref:Uncharacterized protein n=1 Tax=Candidatus Viridilinea halotolerans TaxID=2491704 RepID=A0A426U2W0_9CHLR|nr:MAG: hypothetical protein EI684_07765 [Candidatus Viridilinea halotolerans]